MSNIHKDFVVVPIDKVTGIIALVCKRCYASVIVKELGIRNNPSAVMVAHYSHPNFYHQYNLI